MKYLITMALVAIILFAGCTSSPPPSVPLQQNNIQPNQTVDNGTNNGVGMPNPASKFCVDAGYKLELRDSTGYCVFLNGRECEEWKFFKGECTDADSFTLLQAARYVAEPKELEYKYYADGRLTLTERWLRNGSSTQLTAWLTPTDFAMFVKKLNDRGFASFDDRYLTCSGPAGCPTDMPTMRLTLAKQGNEKTVAVYFPADRPAALDTIVEEFKALFEKNTFVESS